MTNRREILKAAAVSALPAFAVSAAAWWPLRAVLIDRRHAAARRLGAALARRGARTHPLDGGDITEVWQREIDPAWRSGPCAIAGLTERPALFCLEQLAFTHGLRVVFHAEHRVQPNRPTEHSLLRGAMQLALSVRDLERAGPLWPALIGEAFASYRKPAQRMRVGRSEAALAPPLPSGAQLLTSWIIAAA